MNRKQLSLAGSPTDMIVTTVPHDMHQHPAPGFKWRALLLFLGNKADGFWKREVNVEE
jgi:hypothetical protein